MAKKAQPASINQTAIGDDNIQVVGSNNVITRIINFFAGDTEQKRAQKDRRAMLELVRHTWIKGLLEKSLYNEVRIQLGLEERPGAVEHPWDVQVQMPDQPNRTLPPGTSMIEVFDEMKGALLILGEPGSGKTTMLLELARDCIDRAKQDDNQPIPSVFNLSSWDGRQTLDNWLVKELNTKYNVPKKTAENWVENDELQLLLDGLDEVRMESREVCGKAINEFRQRHGLTVPIVVCSRIADYEELKTKLNLSGAVYLQPLTLKQVDDYFKQAGRDLEAIYQILQKDETLQELVKQPLMLSIVTVAYRGKPTDVLESEQNISLEARRKRVFDTYVQEMFELVGRTKNELYRSEQTKLWLAWLAQKMIEHTAVPYLLENMMPKWLNQKKQWNFTLMVGLIVGLILVPLLALIGRSLSVLIFEPSFGSNRWLNLLIGGMLFVGLLGQLVFRLNKIRMVDILIWDWRKGLFGGLMRGLAGGLSLGLIIGLISWQLSYTWYVREIRPGTAIFWGLVFGVLSGGFFGMVFGLDGLLKSGLSVIPISQTAYPGQRISFSTRNGFSIFLSSELFFGLFGVLIGGLVNGYEGLKIGLSIGILFGTLVALEGGLTFGGLAVIQHYALRLIFGFNNYLPFRLIPFLDYCVDRIFLRRVGGGYIFVHRLLMEHFAAMYSEE